MHHFPSRKPLPKMMFDRCSLDPDVCFSELLLDDRLSVSLLLFLFFFHPTKDWRSRKV